MCDLCNDNRFELIEKYKKKLIESTNIETSPEEMQVIDNILFRFWQMDWLDKLEQSSAQNDRWKSELNKAYDCGYRAGFVQCKHVFKRKVGHWVPKEHWIPLPPNTEPLYFQNYNPATNDIKTHYWHCSECDYIGDKNKKPLWNYCPHCGADMGG